MHNCNPTPLAIQSAIIVAMNDLVENADDTLWLTEHETVFERLWTLYMIAGGTEDELNTRFPEYASEA